MNQKTTIEEASREQISQFLPDAIRKALTSYHLFMERDYEEDKPKFFEEHHKACKVAIAHIELLIKLARFADLPDAKAADGNNQIMLAAMLQEAQEELESFNERESDG